MGLLDQNLAALARWMPAMAQAIARAETPAGFARVRGADGAETFCREFVQGESRRLEWLGGTALPMAAADAMVKSLDPTAAGTLGNGLGLSLGSGHEWIAFERRLGRSQMVFVHEPHPGRARLALELCDLSGLLERGRVLLLVGSADEAASALAAFLREHVGFEPPTVLHPLPAAGLAGAQERHALLAAGEAIVRHAVMQRQQTLHDLAQQFEAALARARGRTGPASAPPIVAFLQTPRYASERPIGKAAFRAGAAIIYVDQHASASPAARLGALTAALDRASAGVLPRVMSDLLRPHLPELPDDISLETWVPPLAGPAYWERSFACAAQDRLVVHGGWHARQLESRGIPRTQIDCRPVPVLSPDAAPAAPASGTPRAALFADLPPADASSLGIVLPTHQAVFAAAAELIEQDYLAVHPGMAADLLRRALQRAGVDPGIKDPALQDPMLRILRDVLIPTLPPLALARALDAAGVELTLIGEWRGIERFLPPARLARTVQLPWPAWDSQPDLPPLPLLVHLSPTGLVPPALWDAIARGAAVVSPAHPSDSHPGAIVHLLTPERDLAHPPAGNLVMTVKQLLRDPPRREKLATQAATARRHAAEII